MHHLENNKKETKEKTNHGNPGSLLQVPFQKKTNAKTVIYSLITLFENMNVVLKMKRILLAFIVTLAFINANAQGGNIIGKVKTSDTQPAEFINIGLRGVNKGVTANGNGEYEIKNIKTGIYILVASLAGLETKELKVEVKTGETTIVPEIILKENAQQLNEVMITAYRSNNEKTTSLGKIAIKPMDLPQSIASIDKQLLDRQQTVRLGDAIKNFNGIYIMGTSGGYQEELAGRGFAFTSANTFKNGVRFNNTALPEMSSLERIELMKGSAAILFGNVAPGGVINLVTKKPLFEPGGEITMRLGSYDFYKPSVDVYGPINNTKTAAYRINTTYEKAASFRDIVNSQRTYINPSLLFKVGKKTDILIEGDYLNDNRTADYGVGAINYALINIPRSRFIGVAWSYFKTEQLSSTLTITHRFNDRWQLRNVTSYQNFKSDLFANQRPNGNNQFIQPNGDWIRGLQRTKVNEDYSITQLDLTGKFSTGTLTHLLLIGADADKYNTSNISYNALSKYDTVNVFDMSKFNAHNDMPNITPKTLTSNPIKRAGVYVQDLISVTEKIKVLAGMRLSYLETAGNVFTYSSKLNLATKQYDLAFSPRVGIVYQPRKTTALFTSYANSFTPNSGVDIEGKALPPSYINQYEAGIKNDLFHGLLSANVTLYQIKNSNLAQQSLANGNTNANIKELAGEITSKGIEVDITSKEWKGYSLIAGYSYNDSRYTESNTNYVGTKLLYNPSNTANASIYRNFNNLHIKWLAGFNAGLGVLYIGDRAAGRLPRVIVPNDSRKAIPLPSYTNLEASVGYLKNNISIRVKMTNILNELSYNAHDDNSVNPIAPRQLAATVGLKF